MWEDVGQLHIRKELTALRRARWLKDPSTCSSLKSPKNCIVPHKDGIAGATYSATGDQVKGILHNWTGQDFGNAISHGDETRDRVFKKYQYATKHDYSTHDFSQEEQEGDGDRGLDCNSRSVSPLLTKDAYKSRQQNGNGKHKKRSQILKHAMESYTPTSTRSNSRNGDRKQRSVVGSWDGTALSGEDEVDGLDLPSQGCGIPCYWSRTPKHRGGGMECGTFSPTLSDSVKRKTGNGVSRHQKESPSLSNYDYRMHGQLAEAEYSAEGLPLLTDGASSADGEGTSDGYSTYDMEAACKLERWRKSRDRSREHGHLTLTHGSGELAIYGDRHRSLSQKYRPKSFEELVGQNMVVQTLVSAILRGKIAPVYLFQGPRGTGKTSTARIFAAALNCFSPENLRPCGFCRECIDFASSRSVDVREVDATNSNGMEKVKALLKNVALVPSFSRFKVFIIDECHMLAFETWAALLKILEEPPGHVVFILITTDSDKLPRTALSRCQKYLFPKIKDAEVVTRLQKLAIQENLEVDSDALDMIAAKSEGSLRDAETMLDQLSLLGQRITLSLVHELVGVVSDEKLLDLLELALSADTARTVRRTRELIDSGIEPMTLMSQLATLIMDILAGSYKFGDIKCKGIFFHRHALTEEELERLRRALKILSEAEKQLRVSNDQTTWLTAALLQFGSGRSLLVPTSAGTSATQSPAAVKERNNYGLLYSGSSSRQLLGNKKLIEPSVERSDSMAMPKSVVGNGNGSLNQGHIVLFNDSNKGIPVSKIKSQIHSLCHSPGSGHYGRSFSDDINDNNDSAQPEFSCMSPSKLDELWRRTIEECRSNTLRQLCTQGKLVSVSIGKVVQLEFWNPDTKSLAERYVKSIASSVSLILGCNVEIRINLASLTAEIENTKSRKNSIELSKSSANEQRDVVINSTADQECESTALNSDHRTGCGETCMEAHSAISRTKSFSAISEGYHKGLLMPAECAQADELRTITTGENSGPAVVHGGIEEDSKIGNSSITDEQRLESAWLQAVEKCAPGLKDILKPEKNQVLPRDVIDLQNGFVSSGGIGTVPLGVALQQKEGRSCHEMRTVKSNGGIDFRKLRCARTDHQECLCSSSFDQGAFVTSFEEETLAYGSDSNSSGILCWKALKYDQEKQRRRPRRKPGLLFWVVPCAKAKRGHQIQ
ncbi:protein STICHEL isoform X2 [Cryptomeria japonica]|uniref:protein STICHEL isoform X2 n=1 Tax=Cryptomeria japonica TaxID=3369 RepID=UPI0027DA6E78|nr:protein STICHEL isoform X2 [Cryptomeria japonica]